jgi:uncharacterized membrane protein
MVRIDRHRHGFVAAVLGALLYFAAAALALFVFAAMKEFSATGDFVALVVLLLIAPALIASVGALLRRRETRLVCTSCGASVEALPEAEVEAALQRSSPDRVPSVRPDPETLR